MKKYFISILLALFSLVTFASNEVLAVEVVKGTTPIYYQETYYDADGNCDQIYTKSGHVDYMEKWDDGIKTSEFTRLDQTQRYTSCDGTFIFYDEHKTADTLIKGEDIYHAIIVIEKWFNNYTSSFTSKTIKNPDGTVAIWIDGVKQ